MQEQEHPLLQTNNIRVYPKLFKQTDPHQILSLHDQQLSLTSPGSQKTFPLKDIVGFLTDTLTQDTHKIIISSFPRRKGWFGKETRQIQILELYTSLEEKPLEAFKINILRKITNRNINNTKELKFLAYFNPVAGANSQKQLTTLQHFLSFTNFQTDIIRTEHKNHCKEHLAQINPQEYKAVIIISGDGLMHEFVNSQVCGKLPVSHVPAGSGNGFAKSHHSEAGQNCSTEVAVFLAIKGKTKAFNVFKVDLQNVPAPLYSFLSLQWAFLSDIDINSQFLRCLGGFRFQVYAVWRLISLVRYPGKLIYSFEHSQLPPLNEPITNPQFHLIDGMFISGLFNYIPYITERHNFSPLIKVQDRAIDMQVVTAEQGRIVMAKYLLNSDTGSNFDKEKGQLKEGVNFSWGKIKSFRLEPTGQGFNRGILGIDGEHFDSQRVQVSLSDRQLIAFV